MEQGNRREPPGAVLALWEAIDFYAKRRFRPVSE